MPLQFKKYIYQNVTNTKILYIVYSLFKHTITNPLDYDEIIMIAD